MRHQKAGRKFGRKADARHALIDGLVTNLIRDERIKTTDARAKELRRHSEPVIRWAVSVAEIVQKGDGASPDERAKVIHATRMVRRTIRDRATLHRLFHEVGPRFLGRDGGYTRIMKVGFRAGDAAPVSLVELLPGEAPAAPAPKAEEKPEKASKGEAKSKK